MGRLCETEGLTDIQEEILKTVRTFVDEKIIPVAHELEHKDEYPTEIVEGLKELGLFGLMIPEEYGGLGESLLTYALAVEEIARGWMSVSGIINTHFIVAYMLLQHGTEEQKQKYLPRMATGEVRGAFSMSEPGCGSDVAAIKTKAVKGDDGYTITGQKMWLTNGGSANLVAVLVKTDEGADSVYKNMTTFLVEKESGFGETAQGVTIPGKIDKMGYKGVDTTEMIFEGHRISAEQILGGEPGKGFYQMMDGVEVGRVNVAARGCGVANRAFELGVAYAQQRETFGKKIAEHQAVLFRLAEMATKVEAAHQMMVRAARKKDSGQRNDLEAGMAKYLASEYCSQVVEDSFRIHGGYGFSKEYEIERLYREAPMLLIGEGTADIQRMIIGRRAARGLQAQVLTRDSSARTRARSAGTTADESGRMGREAGRALPEAGAGLRQPRVADVRRPARSSRRRPRAGRCDVARAGRPRGRPGPVGARAAAARERPPAGARTPRRRARACSTRASAGPGTSTAPGRRSSACSPPPPTTCGSGWTGRRRPTRWAAPAR